MAFTPEQVEEFIATLQQDSALRDRVRSAILADDFLALPGLVRENGEQIARLTERMEEFNQRMDALTERMDQLTVRMDALTERMDQLTQTVASLVGEVRRHGELLEIVDDRLGRIEGRLGNLDGQFYEAKYLTQLSGRLGREFKQIELRRAGDDLQLNKALEDGTISGDEWDDAMLLDCVVSAVPRRGAADAVLLAIEVSMTVNKSDVERADRRAGILRRAGLNVLACVDGDAIDAEARVLAEQLRVRPLVLRESRPAA